MYCHFTHSTLPIENAPKVGVSRSQTCGLEAEAGVRKEILCRDVTTIVDMAKKAADLSEGVDFVKHPLWKAEIRMVRTKPTEELHQLS